MKEIQKKNYFTLVVLLVFTLALTIFLSSLYTNKEKLVSDFYEYSNKIKPEEFDEFVSENSELIIYISDKHDLTMQGFEKKFKDKIEKLNLKDNLIYIDKNAMDKDFLKKLKQDYNMNIELEKTPMVIVIVYKKVVKSSVIDPKTNVDALIEYEAFE